MIVGVPQHSQLTETAIGWLNLAWGTAITELMQFKDFEYQFEDIEKDHGPDVAKIEIEKYWAGVNYQVNNAFSLLQQSMELFLKARIAEVSPFLLIVGDPQSWPKPNAKGEIDFSDFRTVDAIHLIKVVNVASPQRLPPEFPPFFDRVRKARNKIAHLHGGQWRVEVKAVLLDILTGYEMLHSAGSWVEFRKRHFGSNQLTVDLYNIKDGSHTQIMAELRACIAELEPRYLKKYLGYDTRKRALLCPNCKGMRADWDDEEPYFVQRQNVGILKCVACGALYTVEEYVEEMGQWE
jgi:hypothetical protein